MFSTIIKALGAAFDRSGIPYMLIGGQAVLLYGEPRFTKDIDVTLGVDVSGLERVLEVTSTLGLRVLVSDPTAFVRRTCVLPCQDDTCGVRVDLVFSWSAYEAEALKRARTVQIDGAPVRYASPEDLLIHKVVAGRARDIEDARSILARMGDLDIVYVRSWLRQFEEALGKPLPSVLESLLKK